MKIKICGITTEEAAVAAANHGADFIGFVFAPSKRNITAERAAALGRLAPGVGKVGVFVNAPLAQVQDIAKQCRLDVLQLSGDEPPAYCAQLAYPIIKTVKVPPTGLLPDMIGYQVDWLLLDTYIPGSYGGTGQTFDWRQAGAAGRELYRVPVLVAGGLTPDNVGEAIREARPQGVDVSGGVETDGIKDPAKIARFIRAARAAERSCEHDYT